jgi:hypothetical protein
LKVDANIEVSKIDKFEVKIDLKIPVLEVDKSQIDIHSSLPKLNGEIEGNVSVPTIKIPSVKAKLILD